jgi:hypothetical protein
MYNSIVYFNSGGNHATSSFTNSCTIPLPSGGGNNIDDDPLFIDPMSNYRLRSDSPCIDTGAWQDFRSQLDLDGNPRFFGASVDMGAYELQRSPTRCDGFCITSFEVQPDSVTITWRSEPGGTYYIEFKAALTDPDWTPVSGAIVVQGTEASWTVLRVAGAASAFYRVVKVD